MLTTEQVEFYYDHPVEFFEDILQAKPTSQQVEILNHIPIAIRNKQNLAVRAGHGVGKSWVEAGLIIWFLCTRYQGKVIATAPSQHQLYDVMWSTLSKHHDKSLLKEHFELTSSRYALKSSPLDWFASARSVSRPENFQGQHNFNLLVIVDEASGIDPDIYEAIEGTATEEGNIIIMFGNPTKLTGPFYDAFNSKSEFYHTMTMSCLDSTNVSKQYPKQIEAKYGLNSDVYRVRVLGEFPKSEEDTIVPIDLIEDAMNRNRNTDEDYIDDNTGIIEIGCDVARFGSDETSIYARKGNYIYNEWISLSNTTMDIVGRIVNFITRNKEVATQFIINIDDTGVGGGVTDRLRELLNERKLPMNTVINAVNNANKAKTHKLYKNIITEMWFFMRDWLKTGIIPHDEKLALQLRARRYGFNSDGRMMVESKDAVKKRGLSSPDRADALLLSCFSLIGKSDKLYSVREKGIDRNEENKEVKRLQKDVLARVEWYKKQPRR